MSSIYDRFPHLYREAEIFNNPPMTTDFKAQTEYPAFDKRVQYNLEPLANSPAPFTEKVWDDYFKIRMELFSPLEHIAFELWYKNVPQNRVKLAVNGLNSKSIYINGIEIYRVDIEEILDEYKLIITRKFAGFVGDGEEIFNRILAEYGN